MRRQALKDTNGPDQYILFLDQSIGRTEVRSVLLTVRLWFWYLWRDSASYQRKARPDAGILVLSK